MNQIGTVNLPAVIDGAPVVDTGSSACAAAVRSRSVGADCVLEAQRLGQQNVRRGLRGGVQVLDAARTAYLSRQWSGEHDRRPVAGILTRTEV